MLRLSFVLLLTEAFVPKTSPPSITSARRGLVARRIQAPEAPAASASSDDAEKGRIPPPLPESEDPFVILDIDRSASGDQKALKKAYLRQAKAYHPDASVTESTPEATKR